MMTDTDGVVVLVSLSSGPGDQQLFKGIVVSVGGTR